MAQKAAIAAVVVVVLLLCWVCGPVHSAHLLSGVIDWLRTFGSNTNVHGGS